MSSDKQFTANGPTDVGFQTDGSNIARGAEIGGNQLGVKGTCGGANGDGVQGFGGSSGGIGVRGQGGDGTTAGASPGVVGWAGGDNVIIKGEKVQISNDGVQGHGTGNFSGVAGFGGGGKDSNGNVLVGTGVYGRGGVEPPADRNFTPARGPGVRGIGGDGPETGPPGPVGVWGQGGLNSDGRTGSPGVVGQAYNVRPEVDADGVVGQGNHSYSGVAGFGGSNRGSGVFGLGGGTDQTGGPGVRGIGAGGHVENPPPVPVGNAIGVLGQAGPGKTAGGTAGSDGLYGIGYGAFSGVAGFGDGTSNSNGTGVFGAGGAPTGPGVRGVGHGYIPRGPEPAGPMPPNGNAVGVFGQAGVGQIAGTLIGASDGVFGVGYGAFSGVAGFGDGNAGNGTGVFGAGGAPTGPGVRGVGHGYVSPQPEPAGPMPPVGNAVGVFGQAGASNTVTGRGSDGVYGIGNGGLAAGVRGVNDGANGVGVYGSSAKGSGVVGSSTTGYGASFSGGFAPLYLTPSLTTGHPASGAHIMGEFYVDNSGTLFYCKTNGVPGTWVKLA